MIYTKKQLYKELKKIGSINIKEEYLINFITGKRTNLRLHDTDKNYYWILKEVEKGKFEIIHQGGGF